jgi:ribosomal protein S17E
MRTHNGNVGAVLADVAQTTFDQLKRYNIPYHEILFGKPYADVYVDDLAVHANLDTYQELGWIAEDDIQENGLADVKNAKKAGIVASRSFNHLQIVGQKLVKSSSANQILGEMFFYSHLPDAVAKFFPQVYEISHMPETGLYSITMQKLKGTTYSHMMVGRSLTAGRLRALLRAVNDIHNASSVCSKPLPVPEELTGIIVQRSTGCNGQPVSRNSQELYDNYTRKLKTRYAQNKQEYETLGRRTTSSLLNTLVTRMGAYESDKRAVFAQVIHGDPVFSNALLNEEERRVYLLDVRSQLGTTLTTAGDIAYDLAKVLQSLQGYDFVTLASDEVLQDGTAQEILSRLVTTEDRMILRELQDEVFWPFVKKNYPEIRRSDLLDIVGSLLFSLIPLHRELVRPIFLQMCQNVVEHGVGIPT